MNRILGVDVSTTRLAFATITGDARVMPGEETR